MSRAKQALEQVAPPNEAEAEQRAWAVVAAAYETLDIVPRRRPRRRFALAAAVAVALGAVALSPAGATVTHLIKRALGVRHASSALFSLPTSGRLLVSGPDGTWAVARDGSTRRLGPWREASWSPRGLYVAVGDGSRLAAVDPRGVLHWAIARRAVASPRWYPPTGFRVAYLSGHQLRVIAGDGTMDRSLASDVSRLAPAWRPGHAYQLAFVTRSGRLIVEDADSGRTLWTAAAGRRVKRLAWTGPRLVAFSPTGVSVFASPGRRVSRLRISPATPVLDGELAPDGHTLALVLGGSGGQVVLEDLRAPRAAPRRVLAGAGIRQVAFSPDGRWLLVSWPVANQWVFVRVAGPPRIAAVSHIRQQFSPHGGFPHLDGWCC